MIFFITKDKDKHKVTRFETSKGELIKIRTPEFFLSRDFSDVSVIGLDKETTGLDAYKDSILLAIVGTEKHQYVIDCVSCLDIYSEWLDKHKDKTFLGHNLKFDIKFAKVKTGILPRNLHDTMIAEQRLLQGCDIEWGLAPTIARRLGFMPEGMDKNIRDEFIGKNPLNFVFENKHILYAAHDIKYLFPLKTRQDELIAKAKQELLIYGIEFPLIADLADAELEGWIINESKWLEILARNKEGRYESQCNLDAELRRLREQLLKDDPNYEYLKGGKYDRNRVKEHEVKQIDLFGEVVVETKKTKASKKARESAYVNYSSTDELIKILGMFRQPIPTKNGIQVVPEFIKGKNGKIKVDKSTHKFTTGAGAIENYIAENPKSPIKSFVETLIKYREYCTRINTFGKTFLTKFKNKSTGRFHTVFRQCNAVTGRFQSGNKDEGYFNSQNIPAEKDYRECFGTDEGYNIISLDYSGCEAVVMIDKAKDERFYQFAIKNDDAHSPLAQAVWRAIGKHRGDDKLANIEISKKVNKDMRTAFKNVTFGDIYNMGIKKYAKTLGISLEEAKIGKQVQRSMLPKTYDYLTTVAKQAKIQGFVIINSRTNSRVWYPAVMDAIKNKSELPFDIEHEVESSARNITIQGTNADIVKEAIVEMNRDFRIRGLDAKIIGQVHDEIIIKYRDTIKIVEVFKNDMIVPMSMKDYCIHLAEEVAGRYLTFIKMKAEASDLKTWTK